MAQDTARPFRLISTIYLTLILLWPVVGLAGPAKPPDYNTPKPPPLSPDWDWLQPDEGFWRDPVLTIEINIWSRFELTDVWFEGEKIFQGSERSGYHREIELPGYGEYTIRVKGIGYYWNFYTGGHYGEIDWTRVIDYRQGVNIEIVDFEFPESADPGEHVPAWVTCRNTGNVDWTADDDVVLQTSGHAHLFGVGALRLGQGTSVSPDKSHTFDLELNAPRTPGLYFIEWQVLHNGASVDRKQKSSVVVGEPVYDAEIVRATIPDHLSLEDEPATLSVTMRNTGNAIWSGLHSISLPGKHRYLSFEYLSREYFILGKEEIVYPGEDYTFTALVRPLSPIPAVLDVGFRMNRPGNDLTGEYFGETARQKITVGEPLLEGEILSFEDIPLPLRPEPIEISPGFSNLTYKLRNNSNAILFDEFRHLYLDEANNQEYIKAIRMAGRSTVATSHTVMNALGPGEFSGKIYIDFKLPHENTYIPFIFHFDYIDEPLMEPFMQTLKIGEPHQNAQILDVDFPETMKSGEIATATLMLKNTGNTIWRKMHLHSLGNPDGHDQPFAWPRQTLPAGIEVAPDETYTFAFEITAPDEPGTYTQCWQMVQDAVEWFGEPYETQIAVEDRSGVPTGHWNLY